MLKSWQKWCRFCGKKDLDDDRFCKMESIENQLQVVNKSLRIELLPMDDIKLSSCDECFIFVEKLQMFITQCLQTDHMFRELMITEDISDSNLQAIRFKYGTDLAEDTKHSDVLSQPKSNQESKEMDPDTDPLDMNDMDYGESSNMVNLQELPQADERESEFMKKWAWKPGKRGRPRNKIDKEKPCVCEVCKKPFSRWYSMNTHFLEKHQNESLPYSCSQCSRSFITEKRLKMHETIHLPEDEKYTQPCPDCGKKFRSVENMRKHIRFVHTKTQTYICEECGKAFGNKSGLVAHYTSHSEDRTFECSYCEKKFKNRLTLRKHEDIHSDRVYECQNCDAKFNTQSCLRGHMVIHSNVKKYKCKLCPNEYKRSNALKNHLTQHSGERPYSCEYCSMTFTNGSNCRNHIKKSHPMEFAKLEAAKAPRKPKKNIPNSPSAKSKMKKVSQASNDLE